MLTTQAPAPPCRQRWCPGLQVVGLSRTLYARSAPRQPHLLPV
ncbi:hypothetical protein [Lysobacter gummosus]